MQAPPPLLPPSLPTPTPPPSDAAQALFFSAVQQLQAGQLRDAQHSLEQACALAPAFAEAYANLGFVLDECGDAPAAEAAYQQALALGANYSQVHLNLGVLLAKQRRLAEAELCYAQAIALDPHSSAAWSNTGALYLALKKEPQAQVCLQKALELNPHNAKAQFNLAYLYLRQGQWEEGWRCLEARDWYSGFAKQMHCPRWQGESVQGKTLLVCYEAGHGDVIQFVRYLPELKKRGAAHLTLVCHPALVGLMASLQGLDAVLALDADASHLAVDYWTPLLSIPYHLQTRADTIPKHIPYLQAQEQKIQRWAAELPPAPLRIGLVWRGNPQFENDDQRSLPSVALLHPLWALAATVPSIQFVGLQKGAGETELDAYSANYPAINLGARMGDFADAAALVAQMDVLITVDTAMAHLAGALGKPCWVLLPHYMTDWRWGSTGTRCAWYLPTMRLFRQTSMGQWQEVVEQVALALQELVGGVVSGLVSPQK